MKKFLYICALAAIAATAVSCSKDNNAAPVKMKTISVSMGLPQPADTPEGVDLSKSLLVDGHVKWTAFDKNIICFTNNSEDKSKGYVLTSTQTDVLANKTFTGSIPEGDEPLFYVFDRNRVQTGNFSFRKGTATYFAVFVDPDQRMTLGSGGNFQPNTYHPGCDYTIAKAGDSEFKHVFGFIKWTNNGSAIKYVKMEPLVSSENIVGQRKISLLNGELDFAHAWDSGTNYVMSGVAAAGDNSLITPDNSYYAIVYPRTYNGMKLTITLAGESGTGVGTTFSIKTDQQFTVERGKVLDMGVLPISAIVKTSGTVETGSSDFAAGWTLE